ncbi:putative leucine-rich repeat-containing protein 52-like [Scophthalmus maximus]|uniref:Putative leucine-rich repeat-containing protein 52-like n=1 Tax=Scophthalmus maximus TaxID=52904 RepID=A0A2U9C3Y3_SCOMX|nr:putative leucine-rich repeat-containing protein 52-like [Scophthalmus maximus]
MRLLPEPSAQSLRLLFLFVFVMGVAPSPALTAGCPDRCVCDDQLVVQCAGQELTQFPNDLPLATRQLIISNNRIGDLPALQLNYLSDLVYLDCSNNSLAEISESTFGNLRKLAYLDLSFNTLLQIEDRTFGPLASLVMLRLTDNPGLSEVHSDAFSENMALQVLDVSRNNLTALNISSLIALPALRSLGLSGNPWRCDCDTEDLCLWVQIEGFKFQDEGQTVCHSPPELAGQRMAEEYRVTSEIIESNNPNTAPHRYSTELDSLIVLPAAHSLHSHHWQRAGSNPPHSPHNSCLLDLKALVLQKASDRKRD